jgi:hypothetical protein
MRRSTALSFTLRLLPHNLRYSINSLMITHMVSHTRATVVLMLHNTGSIAVQYQC